MRCWWCPGGASGLSPTWATVAPRTGSYGATIVTVGPWRGMLLRMAISLLVIVIVWALVLLELRDSISS
jgi:hypothetical protein